MADPEDIMVNVRRAPAVDLFRAVFDRALDAMVITDDAGRYVDGNAAALALLGVTRDEVDAMTVADFARGMDAAAVEETWRGFLGAGVKTGLHQMRRGDGALRGVEVRATANVLPGLHLLALRDVTEQLRAHEATARLASIVDSTHDAISGCDLDGRINYWSPGAERVYGWPAAEVLGQPLSILMADPADAGTILARLGAGEVVRTEGLRRRKDGTPFHAALTAAPMIRDGVVVGASGVTRDISEKYLLEQHLALSERLATAGTLAAGIAHEINNPLAAVVANLEHISHAVAQDATLREPLADAREAVRRITSIVRDLRFLANPGDQSRAPLDVRVVLASTVRIAAQEIRARARLVEDYQPVPRVIANAARLGQVLVNLVVNAAQAIDEGRSADHEIHISTHTDEQGRAVIAVRDTGRGIAPEHVGRIFDPFFTTRPFGGGTGLGLSICHRLVSELGGEIQVQSSGRGTTFTVVLPPAPTAEPAAASSPRAEVRASQARVLVIDDEPIVGRAVRRVLQPAHQVTAVTSARAALDLLAAGERFDLILCDLMMPQMTGMELHEHLTATAPATAARMVFLTGGAFTPAARAFVERVANPCFEKPFDATQLRELVARHLAA